MIAFWTQDWERSIQAMDFCEPTSSNGKHFTWLRLSSASHFLRIVGSRASQDAIVDMARTSSTNLTGVTRALLLWKMTRKDCCTGFWSFECGQIFPWLGNRIEVGMKGCWMLWSQTAVSSSWTFLGIFSFMQCVSNSNWSSAFVFFMSQSLWQVRVAEQARRAHCWCYSR